MDDNKEVFRVWYNDQFLLLRPQPQQLKLVLVSCQCPIMRSLNRIVPTSVSNPSTRPPAAFTKAHTIAAMSSAPCVSLG